MLLKLGVFSILCCLTATTDLKRTTINFIDPTGTQFGSMLNLPMDYQTANSFCLMNKAKLPIFESEKHYNAFLKAYEKSEIAKIKDYTFWISARRPDLDPTNKTEYKNIWISNDKSGMQLPTLNRTKVTWFDSNDTKGCLTFLAQKQQFHSDSCNKLHYMLCRRPADIIQGKNAFIFWDNLGYQYAFTFTKTIYEEGKKLCMKGNATLIFFSSKEMISSFKLAFENKVSNNINNDWQNFQFWLLATQNRNNHSDNHTNIWDVDDESRSQLPRLKDVKWDDENKDSLECLRTDDYVQVFQAVNCNSQMIAICMRPPLAFEKIVHFESLPGTGSSSVPKLLTSVTPGTSTYDSVGAQVLNEGNPGKPKISYAAKFTGNGPPPGSSPAHIPSTSGTPSSHIYDVVGPQVVD